MSHLGNYQSAAVERRRVLENRTPKGTPKELLEWVGSDPERAQRVLDQELESEKPRKTLVQPLKDLLDDDKSA